MNHYSIRAREIGSTGIFFPVIIRAELLSDVLTELKDELQMETCGVSRILVCGKWMKLSFVGED